MAQVFTCADLELTRVMIEDMWADANFKKEVKPEVGIVTALKEMQTAKIDFFSASDKKKKAKVIWVEGCTNAVVECTSTCTFTGEDVSANCKDYEITVCKEAKLQIDDSPFYDNHFDFIKVVAKGLANKLTALDNQIEKDVIAGLDSFASANLYTGDTAKATVVGTDTFIPGSFWNSSLMGYFAKVMRLNYMEDSKMFSGENMWDAFFNAMKMSGNADGKGAAELFNSFGWVFDLKNFDTILGDKKTLMVSPHAAAFVSTHRFLKNEEILNGANIIRYPIASPNIPGVTYDVVYRTECLNGGVDIKHFWKIMANYDILGTPVVCSGSSGVLSFTCGEPVL